MFFKRKISEEAKRMYLQRIRNNEKRPEVKKVISDDEVRVYGALNKEVRQDN